MTGGGASGRPPGELVRPTGEARDAVPGASALGLWIFLASLSMLFAAGLVAYLVVRLRAESWRPAGDGPPTGVWFGTALLLLVSFGVERALSATKRGDPAGVGRGLSAALGASTLFLLIQAGNWWSIQVSGLLRRDNLYAFSFYMLTGLHALHVLGGIVALVWAWSAHRRGRFSWASYAPLRNVAVYWHYLGVVWLILLAILVVG